MQAGSVLAFQILGIGDTFFLLGPSFNTHKFFLDIINIILVYTK